MRKVRLFLGVVIAAALVLSGSSAFAAQKVLSGVFFDNPDYAATREAFLTNLKKEAIKSGLDIEIIEIATNGDKGAFIAKLQEMEPLVDLIYTTGTPNALAVKEAGVKKPVLFSAVANAVGAKLVESNEVPGTNFTGAHCAVPFDSQLRALLLVLPDVTNIGILYNNSDPSASGQAKGWNKVVADQGLQLTEFYIAADVDSAEKLALATEPMIGKVDVIVTTQDSKVSPYGKGMIDTANASRVPTFVGLSQLVNKGALVSLGFNFTETARIVNVPQAIRILKGENPAVIPVGTFTEYKLVINLNTAKQIGVSVPMHALKIASEIVQ
ncbi:MAG: ABC transporter substrate-binding protein [Candidatus Omnitrophota bacterium]